MKINWKIRFKQKQFVIAICSALFISAQAVGGLFGFTLSDELGSELAYTLNTILAVLVLLGVVTDHTTDGVGDSEEALNRNVPKKK